jgi:hypothetical protein
MNTLRSSVWVPLLVACLLGACRCSSPRSQEGTSLSPVAPQAVKPSEPPSLARNVIVRPVFDTVDGRFGAGTAFFVSLPGQAQPLGLTAHHLFGEAGGLERQVPASELGRFVEAVSFHEMDGEELLPAGAMLVLPTAGHSTTPGDWSTDVAAFHAPASVAPRALRLAAKNAAPGEDVWLVAEVLAGKSKDQHLHHARVFVSESSLLAYEFDDVTLQIRATSGAPVVNARGEVVGLNVGGGLFEGSMVGNAHPVESVSAHLQRGLEAAK